MVIIYTMAFQNTINHVGHCVSLIIALYKYESCNGVCEIKYNIEILFMYIIHVLQHYIRINKFVGIFFNDHNIIITSCYEF